MPFGDIKLSISEANELKRDNPTMTLLDISEHFIAKYGVKFPSDYLEKLRNLCSFTPPINASKVTSSSAPSSRIAAIAVIKVAASAG